MAPSCPKCGRAYGEGDPYGQYHNCKCFPAGTLVRTALGERKIEDFKKGDTILTFSMREKCSKIDIVQEVIRHEPAPIWEIHLEGRSKSIRVTAGHSFMTKNGYKETKNLRKGEKILMILDNNIKEVSIDGVHATDTVEVVYNLIVAGSATYIADGALVHSFTYFRATRRLFVNLRWGLGRLIARPHMQGKKRPVFSG